MPVQTIPLLATSSEPVNPDCPGCLPGHARPACGAQWGLRQGPLDIRGSDAALSRLLPVLIEALNGLTQDGQDALDVVAFVHVDDDEAELGLTVPPHCAGARIADAAFQALRQALPERDIYIKHVRRA